MRKALFAEVRRIPVGRVAEQALIAQALNIPVRHAAFLLARITDDEAEFIPWHRVVPRGGDFGVPGKRSLRVERQIERLVAEGFDLKHNRFLLMSDALTWQPDDRHQNTIWADENDAR